MEWRDEGVILSVRKHGETSVIAEVLTAGHGRCLGLVRGGRSRRLRAVLQPGNLVAAVWRARLEEHLGHFAIEPIKLAAGAFLDDPFALAGLTTLCGLSQLLPEREPHGRVYEGLLVVLDAIAEPQVWPALMARWEMGLLDELGFGLDLAKCALTGSTADLVYVSPKSGRAVSAAAGEAYRDRLLRLPPFLREGGGASAAEVLDGLRLTGHFLERHLLEPRGASMPEPRQWIVRALTETAG